MLSNFIQVLNSAREFYTKNYYFSIHNLFTIIYLLQEQELNHKNYSEQKLNMSNFVQANEYDVHMYTCLHYRYFYTNLTLFCLFSIYI
jgi:hypothetical protein